MTIHVIESKPVPRYRMTCSECQSVLEFERRSATEVNTVLDSTHSFVACIKCPVCGTDVTGAAERVSL